MRRTTRLRTAVVIALATLAALPAAAAAKLPYQDPSLPVAQRVDDLLSRMTLAEKVGQMTQTERYQVYDDATPITAYKLGSILSGGGSTPTQNAPAAWADMVDRFQRAAPKAPPRDSAALRDRRRPRRRQHARRHRLPAQHRPRRD